MEELKEMKKKSDVIGDFLEMIAESEDAPLDFKILNESKKGGKLLHEIMSNEDFLRKDDTEEKKAIYSILKQQTQFLTDLKNKIENK